MATKQDAKSKAPKLTPPKATPPKPDWPEFKEVYLFDMETGAFTEVYRAQLGPLPNEKDEYEYICPVHHLKEAPPAPPQGEWPCAVNGVWVMKPDHRGKVVYHQKTNDIGHVTKVGELPKDWGLERAFNFQMDEAVATMQQNISNWSALAHAMDVSVKIGGKTYTFQADDKSIMRLQRTVAMVEKKAIDCPPVWRSADNINVSVTLDDLQAIEVALMQQTQQVMVHTWELKEELAAAVKKQDLKAIKSIVW